MDSSRSTSALLTNGAGLSGSPSGGKPSSGNPPSCGKQRKINSSRRSELTGRQSYAKPWRSSHLSTSKRPQAPLASDRASRAPERPPRAQPFAQSSGSPARWQNVGADQHQKRLSLRRGDGFFMKDLRFRRRTAVRWGASRTDPALAHQVSAMHHRFSGLHKSASDLQRANASLPENLGFGKDWTVERSKQEALCLRPCRLRNVPMRVSS